MGRSRLTLKPIANDASRKSTFRQRSDVLVNKVQELSNLCKAQEGEDFEACLIIYDTNNDDPQPMTWPKNLKAEHSLIQRFERERNVEPLNTFGIQDYFNNKKDKVDSDISKMGKEILKIKYPTNHPCFNNLGDEEIRSFIAILDAKGRACGERMNMLRLQQQVKVNLAQTRSNALNSSQVNSMQNNFETEVIHTHMESFDDSNHIVSSLVDHDVNSQSHMLHFDPNPIQLIGNNNGTMDSSIQEGSPNHVSVPLDLTIQSDPPINSTNQLHEVDRGTLDDELMDFGNLPQDFGVYDSLLGYENVQQGAASHILIPPMDEFQIREYNNMLQKK